MPRDLTFNGVSASSLGLSVMRYDPPIGMTLQPVTVTVPERAGAWFYGATASVRTIPVEIALQGTTVADLYAKLRDIAA